MTTKKSGCGYLSTIMMLTTLLIAGGYGFSKGWQEFFWGTELTPIEAAKIIPEEVFVTSYVNTSTNNWSQLKKINVPEIETIVDIVTKEINQDFILRESKINYQTDISPWLGNMAIAFFFNLMPIAYLFLV